MDAPPPPPAHTDPLPGLSGVAAAVAVVLIWSGWSVASRWSVTESPLGPMELMLLRFGVSGLAMAPVLWKVGAGGLPPREAALLGLLAGPAYGGFAYFGVSLAPAAHASALTAGMLPLFTALFAVAAGVATLTRRRVAALALLLLAAAMFFIDGSRGQHPGAWRGDLLLVCAPATWAVYTLRMQRCGVGAVRATAVVAVSGLLWFLPAFALFGEPSRLVAAGAGPVLVQAIFHGAVVVVGSLFLYTHAVRELGAAPVTLAVATVPGVSALAAAAVLGEPLTGWIVSGIALSATGLIVSARKKKARPPAV